MPAPGHLKRSQRNNLLSELKNSNSPQLTQRILILLLMDDGKTYQEISDFLDCGYRTVAYWCVHGDPDNIESFHDKRENGNYRKATDEYIKLLMETIEKEPIELGYEFGRWSTARLATYLAEVTGIDLSGEQVRRILQKKKYAYLWVKSAGQRILSGELHAKYTLEDKQDLTKRQAFKQKLEGYIEASKLEPEKLLRRETLREQIWFWDEAGFSLRVIRRKSWGKKGTRKKVTGQRSRGRVNVMGGVRFHDKKRVCFFIEKGNYDIFYEQLEQFNDFVKSEWVEQGNKESDFQTLGPKILIILDNASYHKKKGIWEKIENNLPNIQLYFLPAYSPDYNLIELVWHSAKEYIAHRLFKSLSDLQELLNSLLNQGKLIIKWYRQVKNKGNTLIAG